MNKIIIIALCSCVFFSCKKSEQTQENEETSAVQLYEQAIKYKDGSTAIVALNQILLADSNNLRYVDSLAGLYIKTGNYSGGLTLASKVYANDNKNYGVLELIGLANQQLGDYPASIQNFKDLFAATSDNKYLYQVATLHFETENLGAADSIADKILAGPADTLTYIEMSPAGVLERVPIAAACYNLKAMIQAEGKQNFNGAITYLRKALEIYPEFQFPQMYVQRIQQYQQMMMQGR